MEAFKSPIMKASSEANSRGFLWPVTLLLSYTNDPATPSEASLILRSRIIFL